MMGLRAALNWRMDEPVYRGQTKDELASEVDSEVKSIVLPKLALFLKQNPQLVKRLADRAARFKKNEERFKADNKAVRGLELGGKDDQAIDPSKLIQSDPGVPPHLRELVLVEGDSAGGTAERAKAPHHEILKLRGVSINAQRQDPARVLGNREIKLLIKAIGIKPGETDLKKMRVGSITILTDADPDGKHIASLLLSFFKVYYPEIVRQKKLRSINGPLFLGQLRDNRVFGDTKDEVLAGFAEGQRNQVRITRFKGWGEASEDQLEHIAFNPKTRRLVVLTMGDEDEVRIAAVMGKDVEHRKELLFGTSNNQEN
jgi:DNA gyrase/topoisomerase IV subunit B